MTFDQLARHAGHKIDCWMEKTSSVGGGSLIYMEDDPSEAKQVILWCQTCETTIGIVENPVAEIKGCKCPDCQKTYLGM